MAESLTFDPIYLCIENFILHPYVRMTRKSMFVDKYAQAYLANQAQFRELALASLEQTERVIFGDTYLPDRTPFQMVMLINVIASGVAKRSRISEGTQSADFQNHHCDLDNLVKSVLDASTGLLFKDDRYCDHITAHRYFNTYDQNLLLVAIGDMNEDPLDLLANLCSRRSPGRARHLTARSPEVGATSCSRRSPDRARHLTARSPEVGATSSRPPTTECPLGDAGFVGTLPVPGRRSITAIPSIGEPHDRR